MAFTSIYRNTNFATVIKEQQYGKLGHFVLESKEAGTSGKRRTINERVFHESKDLTKKVSVTTVISSGYDNFITHLLQGKKFEVPNTSVKRMPVGEIDPELDMVLWSDDMDTYQGYINGYQFCYQHQKGKEIEVKIELGYKYDYQHLKNTEQRYLNHLDKYILSNKITTGWIVIGTIYIERDQIGATWKLFEHILQGINAYLAVYIDALTIIPGTITSKIHATMRNPFYNIFACLASVYGIMNTLMPVNLIRSIVLGQSQSLWSLYISQNSPTVHDGILKLYKNPKESTLELQFTNKGTKTEYFTYEDDVDVTLKSRNLYNGYQWTDVSRKIFGFVRSSDNQRSMRKGFSEMSLS